MAATTNGLTNGHAHAETAVAFGRFTDIPAALDIPVSGGEENEAVEVGLEDLPDDPTELCTLLENENVGGGYWITIALAYAKQQKPDLAIDIIKKGLSATSRSEQKLMLYNCLCWLFLLKSRQAPRARPEGRVDADITIKDDYLRQAVATLNDASRIHPGYPPLHLARGVLCLLRASIQNDQNEKRDTLRQSLKSFEDALNTSKGKDMMAYLGRARAYYSLGKYANALQDYQHVLEHAPDLTDPDPRIGIGCCFWQLGHKDEAKMAWERAAEVVSDVEVKLTFKLIIYRILIQLSQTSCWVFITLTLLLNTRPRTRSLRRYTRRRWFNIHKKHSNSTTIYRWLVRHSEDIFSSVKRCQQ